MKLRYRIAIALLTVASLIAGGSAVLFYTPVGLHWAVGLIESRSGDALRIGSVEGSRLAGPLTLRNVKVTVGGTRMTVRELRIRWTPLELLTGTVHVHRLTASGVNVISAGGATSAQGGVSLPQRLSLPVSVTIDRLSARDVNLATPKPALHLARVNLALHADANRVRISALVVHGPRIDLSGRLSAVPRGDWPATVALFWRLQPAASPAISGATRIHGTIRRRLVVDQRIDSPFLGHFAGTVRHPLVSPSWNGKLELSGLNPHRFRARWPVANVAAVMATRGSLQQLRARGTIRIRAHATYTVNLDLDAAVATHRIRIRRLHVVVPGSPGYIDAQGIAQMDAHPQVAVSLHWQDLRWPLTGRAPRLFLPAGEARLDGQINDWKLTARTGLVAPGLPEGIWRVDARGDREHALLTRLDGHWLGGRVSAHGHASFGAAHRFALRLNAHGLHPQALTTGWTGSIGLAARAQGTLAPLRAHIHVLDLAGKLNGSALSGNAAVAVTDQGIDIDSARLALGNNRAHAHGHWGKQLSIDWVVRASELSKLDPHLSGSVRGDGSVAGSPQHPRVAGTLEVEHLDWRHSVAVGAGRSRFDIGLGAGEPSTFTLDLHDVSRGNVQASRVLARLEGPADAQRFALEADTVDGRLRLAARGALSGGRWQGRVNAADIELSGAGAFRLDAGAPLLLSRQALTLGRTCWSGPQRAQICLAADRRGNRWRTDLTLREVPLDLADPLLAGRMTLSGRMDGALYARGGGGHLEARALVQGGPVVVSRQIAGTQRKLTLSTVTADVRLDDRTATANADIHLAGGGDAQLTASIPWKNHRLPAGKLHVVTHLPDLSGLDALTPSVSGIAGRLDADLTLSGNWRSPRVKGSARLSQGALTYARTGTHLRGVAVDIRGDGTTLVFQGDAEDGKGGRMTADGHLTRQGGHWTLHTRLSGKAFRIADMPEARVRVSPDLRLVIANRLVQVTGKVAVPSAQIRPPEFSQAVSPTPDLIVVGASGQEKPSWRITTRLRIALGDDVHFNGYGLTAQIGGAVTIDNQPGKLTTGSGELDVVKGQYRAYGQDLTIRRGRLLFSGGPVANPGLDLRATRTVGSVVAGLDITGTLREPRLQVFSNPPMSQSDALAYLLFGHGMQQTSGSEKNTFASAASAIGIAGGTYLAKSIGKNIGVDTVSVESASRYETGRSQSSLFLGKYLSPRLYVSYGIGLFAPINLVRVRYELSRHWALEAESGTISGADILFNISH